jgi:hypothetical protein
MRTGVLSSQHPQSLPSQSFLRKRHLSSYFLCCLLRPGTLMTAFTVAMSPRTGAVGKWQGVWFLEAIRSPCCFPTSTEPPLLHESPCNPQGAASISTARRAVEDSACSTEVSQIHSEAQNIPQLVSCCCSHLQISIVVTAALFCLYLTSLKTPQTA